MSKHLIISIHGIWTLANWQKSFREMIHEAEPHATVHEYKYSVVSAYSLFPGRRERKVRQFAAILLDEFSRDRWDRIDIVAHSFGTYLVAEALRYLVRTRRPEELPRLETLILAGSVLPTDYPWRELTTGIVRRVVNDCGVDDHVLWLPEILVPRLGFGGRIGFNGLTGHYLHNRYFLFGHSGFSMERKSESDASFMKTWWLPLLTATTSNVPAHDARLDRKFPTLIGWLERQVNFLRLFTWLLLLSIPVVIASAYINQLKALNQETLAESWALQSLHQRDTAPMESARLAIASAKLHKTPRTEQALLHALNASAKPVATVTDSRGGWSSLYAIDGAGTQLAEAGILGANTLFVRIRPLMPGAQSREQMFHLPDQRCSQKRQPEKLHFSESGRYLILTAFDGSCVLDTRSMRWIHDLDGYDHITPSQSEAVFFASRKAGTIAGTRRLPPPLSAFRTGGRTDVEGMLPAGWLRDIAAITDSGVLAADSGGRVWIAPSDRSPALQLGLPGGDTTAQAVAVNAAGSQFAIGTERGQVVMVDAAGLTTQWKAQIGSPAVALAFSRDGKHVAAQSADGTARIWSAQDGIQLAAFDGGGYPLGLRFLGADGSRILTVNRGAHIKVWSVPSQSLLVRVPPILPRDKYALDSGGHRVLVQDATGAVTLWDTDWQGQGRALHMDEGIHEIRVRGDGRYAAALGNKGQLRVWDTANQRVLLDVPRAGPDSSASRSSLDISEDGRTAVSITESGNVIAWRAGKGKVFELQLPRVFADTISPPASTAEVFRSLPAGTDPRLLQQCDAQVPLLLERPVDGAVPKTWRIHRKCTVHDPQTDQVKDLMSTAPWMMKAPLALSADGRLLALSFLGDVLLLEIDSGKLIASMPQGYERRAGLIAHRQGAIGPALVRWLAFSGDGRRLLVSLKNDEMLGYQGNIVHAWDFRGDRSWPVRSLALGSSDVDVGYSPGLSGVLSLSDGNKKLHLWDETRFEISKSVDVGRFIDGAFNSVWHSDSLLVLSHDPHPLHPRLLHTPRVYVDIFDARTLNRKHHLALPLPATNVMLSPSGTTLLVMDDAGKARTVEVATGKVLAEFGLGASPKAMWFRADETLFYTEGGQMQYWLPIAGEEKIRSLVWRTDELVGRLCSTLPAAERDFSTLSSRAGKPIGCD